MLIVHTHTCESYMDADLGYYYEDYYPRTDDPNHNVTRVGGRPSPKSSRLQASALFMIPPSTIPPTAAPTTVPSPPSKSISRKVPPSK